MNWKTRIRSLVSLQKIYFGCALLLSLLPLFYLKFFLQLDFNWKGHSTPKVIKGDFRVPFVGPIEYTLTENLPEIFTVHQRSNSDIQIFLDQSLPESWIKMDNSNTQFINSDRWRYHRCSVPCYVHRKELGG